MRERTQHYSSESRYKLIHHHVLYHWGILLQTGLDFDVNSGNTVMFNLSGKGFDGGGIMSLAEG